MQYGNYGNTLTYQQFSSQSVTNPSLEIRPCGNAKKRTGSTIRTLLFFSTPTHARKKQIWNFSQTVNLPLSPSWYIRSREMLRCIRYKKLADNFKQNITSYIEQRTESHVSYFSSFSGLATQNLPYRKYWPLTLVCLKHNIAAYFG
jgi:hypothetical protein